MKRIELETASHDKIMDLLTRQRDALELKIQEWMSKYEDDLEAKVNELETLKQKRSQDSDKFEELVSSFEELEKVVIEERQKLEKEREEIRLEKARNKAAGVIQRTWRNYKSKSKQVSIRSYFLIKRNLLLDLKKARARRARGKSEISYANIPRIYFPICDFEYFP